MSKVNIADVLISYPQLFEPVQTASGEGKAQFSAAFLISKDHPAIKKINAAIKEVADAKWGAKSAAQLKALQTADKVCLHDGDNKADYAGYEGNFFINASNATQPTVLNRDKSPLRESDGVIYSGCYVNAIIEVWAQDNKYGKRINATLSGVQFLKDGDAFSGGRAAGEDEFEDLGAPADADDDL